MRSSQIYCQTSYILYIFCVFQLEHLRQSGDTVITAQTDTDESDSMNVRQAQNHNEKFKEIVEHPSVTAAKKVLHWKGMKPARDSGSEEVHLALGVQKDEPSSKQPPDEEVHVFSKKEESKASSISEDNKVKVNSNKSESDTAEKKELKTGVLDTNNMEYNEKRSVADAELSSNLKKQLSDVSTEILITIIPPTSYCNPGRVVIVRLG